MPVIISFSVFITSYLLLGFSDNFGLTNLIARIYFMLIIFVLMSIGIIFSNKPLQSSCGSTCECTFKEKIKCTLKSNN